MNARRLRYGGPIAVVVAALVPVALWAAAAPLSLRFLDTQTALRSVAIVCGLVGFVLFAANLLLGGRFAFIEPFFGGLDRMYRIHHSFGVWSFLLLASHGILMLGSTALISASAVWDLVLPRTNWTVTLGVLALLALSVVMGITLYVRLSHEVFLWVHRALGVIFAVGAIHVFRTPGTKAISQALTIYLALVALAGLGAYLYRSLLGDALVPRRDYRIGRIRKLGDVAEITMSPLDRGLDFRPGQFVFLTFHSGSLAERFRPFSHEGSGNTETISLRPGAIRKQFHPFSITSSPKDRDLRVAIKASGDYTTALENLVAGDGAVVEGPYGGFSYLTMPGPRQIWIAGGIGVTPFLSMAASIEASYRVDLYYCSKSRSDAHYLEELEGRAHDSSSALRLIFYPEDERGFLTAEEVERTSGSLGSISILMCGPPAMTGSLAEQFVRRGVPRARIHYEQFGFN
jgi:predicted ferric reductase